MNDRAGAAAIAVDGLVKDYARDWRGRGWRALHGLSFAVPRGELCGLIGPNGSGKSTTLRLLAGLSTPTAGRVTVQGRIGYVPEAPGLPAHESGRGWLQWLAGLSGHDSRVAAAAADRALASVGLTAAADRKIGTYSQGMRQRLGLAQAWLDQPDVLLLDEPAAGLDPHGMHQFTALLAEARARGQTVVLTSHYLPQLETLCDRIVVLGAGRVQFAGERAAVAAAGGLENIYLRHTTP